MVQSTTQPVVIPLVEDISVKESFSDSYAGTSFVNGNVHITFTSITDDHTKDPTLSRRIVTARVVMSIAGAIDLRDTLTRLIDMLVAQGTAIPVPNPPTTISLPETPN